VRARRPPGMLTPALACLVTAVLAVALVIATGLGGPTVVLWVSDLAQLVLASTAGTTTLRLAARLHGRLRTCWALMGTGFLGWAAGQAVWSWYELVLGRETPFPSPADFGFLLLPVTVAVGLWAYPAGSQAARWRRGLDAATVTAALGLVWWSTALGVLAEGGAQDELAFWVGLAYPASDLAVLTLVVLLLSRVVHQRAALSLVGAGIAAISVSDSGFAYLATTDAYGGGAVDLGWVVGFALVAAAPWAWDWAPEPVAAATDDVAHRPGSALPYVPVVLAGVTVAVDVLAGDGLNGAEGTLAGLVVLLVLTRQWAVLRENLGLVKRLADREAQLRHLAFHDGLTGLANRALFADRVSHALDLHSRDGRPVAVLFCDLDDFKVVNDTLGHAAGDELLVRVAERLRGALRAGDTLARLGGDEFAVLLEDGGAPVAVASNVVHCLSSPFTLGGRALEVGVSIGFTTAPAFGPATTADVLLTQADTAMYAAKRAGKGTTCAFELGMELAEVTDDGTRRSLGEALQTRALRVAYQPIVDVQTGRVRGLEALARWDRDGVAVPPDVFIAAAERTGLIADLTALVLDLVCTQVAAWERELGRTDLTVAVNVCSQQITDLAFPGQVRAVLQHHRVRPQQLVLEITESGLLTDPDAAGEVTAALRRLGVGLSLDDFGTGYSSLAHLRTVPVDTLKIDRGFVDGLGRGAQQDRFTSALLRLGDDLGLAVVAEGVEHPEQLEALRALGCRLAQGYLLGRPQPAADLTARLRTDLAPIAVPAQA